MELKTVFISAYLTYSLWKYMSMLYGTLTSNSAEAGKRIFWKRIEQWDDDVYILKLDLLRETYFRIEVMVKAGPSLK